MLIRSVGGRSGPLALENGAPLTFPWARQQRIPNTETATVRSFDSVDYAALSLVGPTLVAGANQAYIELRGWTDSTSPLIMGDGTGSYIEVNNGNITLNPLDDLFLQTSTGVINLVAKTSVQISNDATSGTDITVNSNRDLFLQADNDANLNAVNGDLSLSAKLSMVMANDATSGTDITIQSNRDLFLNADRDLSLLATTGLVLVDGLPITGAWNTTFSPVVKQNNTTVASTVTYSHYWRVGHLVIFVWWSAITGTGTAGTAITVTIPFDCAGTTVVAGIWSQYDASLNQHLVGVARLYSTTEVSAVLHGANNWIGISGYAEALVNTDAILGMVVYETT